MSVVLAALALPGAMLPEAEDARCRYDRAAMLALDRDAFDQDMAGGWRKLNNVGCDAAAADLLRDWRDVHKATDGILFWHEGQMRANAGQTVRAIALFDRARETATEDKGFGWNLYVDGSIAFLKRDRKRLRAARQTLAALPRPPGFNPLGANGKPFPVAWPINLNVLDGFERCWNRPYKAAYSCAATFKIEAGPAQ